MSKPEVREPRPENAVVAFTADEPEPSRARAFGVLAGGLFLLVMAYAVVRYHLYKGVPWQDLPLYTTNKAISVTALVLIALSYLRGVGGWFGPRVQRGWSRLLPWMGLGGYGFAAVHVLVSLLLLRPEYYGKFFGPGGSLNWSGQLTLVFGILAFALYSVIALCSLPAVAHALASGTVRRIRRAGVWGLALAGGHLAAMGLSGWLEPAHWPGGLLPISLLAFCVAAGSLFLRVLATLAGGWRPRRGRAVTEL